MLTEPEQSEIRAELARCPNVRAAVPEALKIVQRHRRWVSDDAVRGIADLLGLSAAEIDQIATFYSLIYRRPVGRHVILLCDSVSCYAVAHDDLAAGLRRRLGIEYGQTTPDGRFTLLPVACLGACEQAPAMMIDEDLHGDLTDEKIAGILERYP